MVDLLRGQGFEPELDLEAMLEDLHNDFQGPPPGEEPDETPDLGAPQDVDPVDEPDPVVEPVDEDPANEPDPLDDILEPGMVRVGSQILPQVEVDALLNLNAQVKADPEKARMVREAILGQQAPADVSRETLDPDALPVFIDPDDAQAVFFYRQQQATQRELEQLQAAEAQRMQAAAQQQESTRVTQVRDAFRTGMKEFRDSFPQFDLADMNAIANAAANMGLMENPERIGGTLQGGIVKALETAMWATPAYREKANSGATVPNQQDRSTRKRQASALSSSTGSSPRTQSQEATPTTRQEVMAGALDFLKTQGAQD